jgi:hypothetical protein
MTLLALLALGLGSLCFVLFCFHFVESLMTCLYYLTHELFPLFWLGFWRWCWVRDIQILWHWYTGTGIDSSSVARGSNEDSVVRKFALCRSVVCGA